MESSTVNSFGEKEVTYKYTLREFWIRPKDFDVYVLKGSDRKTFLPLLVKDGYIKKEKMEKVQEWNAQKTNHHNVFM